MSAATRHLPAIRSCASLLYSLDNMVTFLQPCSRLLNTPRYQLREREARRRASRSRSWYRGVLRSLEQGWRNVTMLSNEYSREAQDLIAGRCLVAADIDQTLLFS